MQQESVQDNVVITEPVETQQQPQPFPQPPDTEVYQEPPIQPPEPPQVQSSSKKFLIIALFIIVLLLGGTFLILKSLKRNNDIPIPTVTPTVPTTTAENILPSLTPVISPIVKNNKDDSSLDLEANVIEGDLKVLDKVANDTDTGLNDKQQDLQ